jgi:hypothetical protein
MVNFSSPSEIDISFLSKKTEPTAEAYRLNSSGTHVFRVTAHFRHACLQGTHNGHHASSRQKMTKKQNKIWKKGQRKKKPLQQYPRLTWPSQGR